MHDLIEVHDDDDESDTFHDEHEVHDHNDKTELQLLNFIHEHDDEHEVYDYDELHEHDELDCLIVSVDLLLHIVYEGILLFDEVIHDLDIDDDDEHDHDQPQVKLEIMELLLYHTLLTDQTE